MNLPALERFADFRKQNGLSSALLSNPATIAWLTSYAPPIQTGPNPFEGGPALAWITEDGLVLVISDSEAGPARALAIEVCEYGAYTIEAPAAGFQNQAAVLLDLLRGSRGLKGGLAVELNFLPASLYALLKEVLPSTEWVPIDSACDGLRAVKSPQEVELITKALALSDLAQLETRRLIRPGITEIELWAQVKGRLESEAGGRLPVLADFIAGPRTAEVGGPPTGYVLRAGDPLIADIVPRVGAYWGDNCGTHFVESPSPEINKVYRLVREVLAAGIAAIHPGLRACDLDRQMRQAIENAGYPVYPHHSGHGLGTAYHEEPRIVPYNTATLERGMVIALEPGVYIPGLGGVRLEDVVLVTSDGCEVLTRHLARS